MCHEDVVSFPNVEDRRQCHSSQESFPFLGFILILLEQGFPIVIQVCHIFQSKLLSDTREGNHLINIQLHQVPNTLDLRLIIRELIVLQPETTDNDCTLQELSRYFDFKSNVPKGNRLSSESCLNEIDP